MKVIADRYCIKYVQRGLDITMRPRQLTTDDGHVRYITRVFTAIGTVCKTWYTTLLVDCKYRFLLRHLENATSGNYSPRLEQLKHHVPETIRMESTDKSH